MKLSDYLAKYLVKAGVRHVFQIIGGASVHMVNSIAANPKIDYICVQHEQAGAMAAEAYARITKNIGVAMATSGPGMTNLITGIACAYFDSTPALYLTGQVNTDESKQGRNVRQIGFQETDIVDMVKSITKFSVRVDNPNDIRYYLEKAVFLAKSGRPGPVVIDIPMNVQRATINPLKLRGFNPKEVSSSMDSVTEINKKIEETFALMSIAKRPVIIAGGGVRYADKTKQFELLVNKLGFPVVSTWSGIDVLPHDHPLYRGQIGVYGNRGANFTIQNSDLFISFGTRLDTRITGGRPDTFAKGAKKVVMDIDKSEIYKNRGLYPDIGIIADVRKVIPQMIKRLGSKKFYNTKAWNELTRSWKNEYPAVLPEWRKRSHLVDPYVFIETLSKQVDPNAVIITDCGANLTWTIQAFKVKRNQRLISAMGNSPMGYSMAASIGASIAMGKKPIICIIGDGGFQINIQELQTIAHYKIPLKIFVLNNHAYGIILQFQDFYFKGKYEGTTPKTGYSMPDFLKVSRAYGIPANQITNHKDMARKIRKVLLHKGPFLSDVIIPQQAQLIPKLEFGNPIDDLSPKLPRTEYNAHLIKD